jgi:hypothetical protein
MRIPNLLPVLAFLSAGFLLPAAAEPPTLSPAAATLQESTSPEACLANAKGMKVTQIDCCKGHKGICGCRAGKIVCCDNTVSTEPGCTCHGDDGFAN